MFSSILPATNIVPYFPQFYQETFSTVKDVRLFFSAGVHNVQKKVNLTLRNNVRSTFSYSAKTYLFLVCRFNVDALAFDLGM